MSDLDHIIDTVSKKSVAYPYWNTLRQFYFTSDNPIEECKDWAQKNNLYARFTYKEESFTFVVVDSVSFEASHQARNI